MSENLATKELLPDSFNTVGSEQVPPALRDAYLNLL